MLNRKTGHFQLLCAPQKCRMLKLPNPSVLFVCTLFLWQISVNKLKRQVEEKGAAITLVVVENGNNVNGSDPEEDVLEEPEEVTADDVYEAETETDLTETETNRGK